MESARGLKPPTIRKTAAAIVVFVTKKDAPEAPAQPPAPQSAVVAPHQAETPQKVKIRFTSAPAGAQVTRSDDGKVLGTTPFHLELPYSKEPMALVFKKASFKDATLTLIPETSAPLTTTLIPEAPAEAS